MNRLCPSPFSHNQLDLWYGIIHTFFNIFLWSIFTHFYRIFDPHFPVQVNGENFQVQNFVFLTSELKSTLNFCLENILYSIFWPTFFSTTKCPRNLGRILNPVIAYQKKVFLRAKVAKDMKSQNGLNWKGEINYRLNISRCWENH